MWAVPGRLLAEVSRAKVRGVGLESLGEIVGDMQTDGQIMTHAHEGEPSAVTAAGAHSACGYVICVNKWLKLKIASVEVSSKY